MRSTVQGPDGGYITVEHPEDATPDQIITFARANYKPIPAKIGKEGLAEAAQQVGAEKNVVGKLGTGIGAGMQSMAHGLTGLLPGQGQPTLSGLIAPTKPPEKEAREVAAATVKGAGPIAQGAEIAAQIAPTIALPARGVASLVQGGAGKVAGALASRPGQIADVMTTAGAISALTSPEDRALHSLLSAGTAGAIPAAAAVSQAVGRRVTRGGREVAVAENLTRELGDQRTRELAIALREPYPYASIGTAPTAGMKAQDPTLQTLELGARTRRPDLFAPADEANAIARWNALQAVAKDEPALAAAVGNRDRITSGLREEALTLAGKQGFEMPVAQEASRLLVGESRSNPAVQKMANYVLGELEQGVTPQQLYTIRKTLTDAVPHGTELGSSIRQARAERMALVDSIDHALDQASDGAWRLYLKAYGGFSQPVTSMKAGQAMSDVFQHTPNRTSAATGSVPVMTPAALSRALSNFGEKEFGSKTISRITPEERQTVEAVINDLTRQQEVMRARGIIGSDTAAKIAAGNRADDVAQMAISRAGDAVLPFGVGSILGSTFGKASARRREETLAELLRDPEKLAQAIERVAPGQAVIRRASETGRATRSLPPND